MKTYNNIPLTHETDIYATHQPALIWALEQSTGDVLELGIGECSTIPLHEILKGTNRKLVSVEDNMDWIGKFVHLQSEEHRFDYVERSVEKWVAAVDEYAKKSWGVVFVDQGYGEEIWRPARNYSVKKLVDCADFVVAHDADIFAEMQSHEYNWLEYIPFYKPDPKRKGPSTYIISKKHSLKDIKIAEI